MLKEDTSFIVFLVNLVMFGIFYIVPAYFGGKFMRSIFIRKNWNPTAGVIVGGLIGIVFSIVGFIVIWLIYVRVKENIKKYPFYRGGPERFEVTWTYGIKNMTVLLDGVEVGQINNPKEAKKGKTFTLSDGSQLLLKIGGADDLYVNPNPLPIVELNGKPLPNSANDPAYEISVTAKAFLVGGVSTILKGLIVLGISAGYGVYGLLLGIAAVITGNNIKRRSRIALNVGYLIAVISAIDFFIAIGSGESFFEGLFNFVSAVMFVMGVRKTGKALTELEKEGSGK